MKYVLTMIFLADDSFGKPMAFSSYEQAKQMGFKRMKLDYELPERLRMYNGFKIEETAE